MSNKARWHVFLEGTKADIEALKLPAKSWSYEIIEDDREGMPVLRGDAFDRLEDAKDVRSEAVTVLRCLNGMARLRRTYHKEVIPTGCIDRVHPNGHRDISVEVNTFRVHASLDAVLVREGESVEDIPPDPRIEVFQKARNCPVAAEALEALSSNPTRQRLRFVYQLIKQQIGGYEKFIDYGWITKEENDNFHATMHDKRLGGIEALHGDEFKRQPRGKNIGLEKCSGIVWKILEGYINMFCP